VKKVLSALMAVSLLLTCFAGLASAETTKDVLNFYIASDMEQTASAVAEAYNASQDKVEVKLNVIPNDGYDDKMKVLTTGDSDIDVFWVRTPAQVKKYMANGVLVDLKPFAEASGLDTAPIKAPLEAVSDENGGFYGLPISGSCWMLFYNKDLFDKKGLPYPENITWEEYADLAKQLTYEENGTKYWGGVAPFWTPNLGAAALGEYLDAPEPMTLTMDYMKILHRLYVDDASHPSIAEMTTGTFDINSYFAAGNIYMMINGDWEFRLLKTDFNYAAAPLPVMDKNQPGVSVGQNSVLSIYKGSAKQEEAYKFIEFYTTSVEGTSIIAKNHDVPSYATPEAMAVYQEEVKVPGVEYRFSSTIRAEQGTADYYAAILEDFSEEMKLYLLGEESLEDAFTNYYALRAESMAD
jgi:ABC-type glycerol-3-phosphate transport system substrate-binding protein